MAEIFEKRIKQVGILVTDARKAKAIGDPIRSDILHILSKQEGSIADIKVELKKLGIDIAPTTVRHHLDILKKAGLVDLTKLVDSRGGMLKYYASNVRLMEHRAPEDFDKRLKGAIEEASDEVLEIAKKLIKNHGSAVRDVARSLKPCPHCSQEHFTEYVILEALNRAIASASQRKKFRRLLRDVE